MNKEYEDLLNYITTFERSQQQEEIKLAEEVAKHKHTQQSIRNGMVLYSPSSRTISNRLSSSLPLFREQRRRTSRGTSNRWRRCRTA